jgi:hypothetical protein
MEVTLLCALSEFFDITSTAASSYTAAGLKESCSQEKCGDAGVCDGVNGTAAQQCSLLHIV